MDFVSVWKTTSIVVTGVFGVLGLVTEFKHPETKRVTRWGKVALGGIIVSTVFGTAAQIEDSSRTSEQALRIATQSSQTLQDIQRQLSPLEGALLSARSSDSCHSHSFAEPCAVLRRISSRTREQTFRTRDFNRVFGERAQAILIFMHVYDSQDQFEKGHSSLELLKDANDVIGQRDAYIEFDKSNDNVEVVLSEFPTTILNEGDIYSIRDLDKKIALIKMAIGEQRLTLIGILIAGKAGNSVGCGERRAIMNPLPNNPTAQIGDIECVIRRLF